MRQLCDTQRLQFSKIPVPVRVLEEKKNLGGNQYYLKPTTAAKTVTFGAKLTNLSNSNVSMISSTSSLGYSNHLTLSRSSFDSQMIETNENRMSFNILKNQRAQPLTSRENNYSMLSLTKKAQSNISDENQTSQTYLDRYKVKPTLEQSIVFNRHDTHKLVDSQIYQRKLEQQSIQIKNLKQEIQNANLWYEEELRKFRESQGVLEHSIMELNMIVFELRNTKEYQTQIIQMLEEKSLGFNDQREQFLRQNDELRRQIKDHQEANQKLQSIAQQYNETTSSRQIVTSISFESRSQIPELQKTISNQNTIIKNSRNELKRCQEKIHRLEKFVQQSNTDVFKEDLFMLNKRFEGFDEVY